MTKIEDLRYMRSRAVQEQAAAEAALCSPARQCHEKLAAEYEARAIQLALGLHLCKPASFLPTERAFSA